MASLHVRNGAVVCTITTHGAVLPLKHILQIYTIIYYKIDLQGVPKKMSHSWEPNVKDTLHAETKHQ